MTRASVYERPHKIRVTQFCYKKKIENFLNFIAVMITVFKIIQYQLLKVNNLFSIIYIKKEYIHAIKLNKNKYLDSQNYTRFLRYNYFHQYNLNDNVNIII